MSQRQGGISALQRVFWVKEAEKITIVFGLIQKCSTAKRWDFGVRPFF
jgi:hypothetical protein